MSFLRNPSSSHPINEYIALKMDYVERIFIDLTFSPSFRNHLLCSNRFNSVKAIDIRDKIKQLSFQTAYQLIEVAGEFKLKVFLDKIHLSIDLDLENHSNVLSNKPNVK